MFNKDHANNMMPSRHLTKLKLILLMLVLSICLDKLVDGDDATTTTAASSSSSTSDDAQTETTEEFPHLLHRAALSKRVHLVSELTRNGHRLILEEFLDLENWNQFLQFKWNEDDRLEGESQALSTKKISIIVMNDGPRKILVQFEPFMCDISVTNSTDPKVLHPSFDDAANWWALVNDCLSLNSNNPKIKPRSRHMLTIQSIMSTNLNSPYLARVPISNPTTHQDPPEAWVFGIAGIWLKARYPGGESSSSVNKVANSEAWRLDLKESYATMMYYFDESEMGDSMKASMLNRHESIAEYELLQLIELRNSKTTHLVDLIQVVDVDFKFSKQLLRDLFKLPIGYRCPANPILVLEPELRFMDNAVSQETLFETVATRYGTKLSDTTLYSATDVKGLSIATCKHPMNSLAYLTKFHILEDHLKIIRDYHSRIMYEIHLNGTTTNENNCQISPLHIFDFQHSQATNPIEISYSNGIQLHLNEIFLEYLMNSRGTGKLGVEQVYLNRIESLDSSKEELIFETQVPDSYTELVKVLDKLTGKPIARKISLIRVYERPIADQRTKYKLRSSRLAKLVRIVLVVFDYRRQERLAEIRFNLISVSPLMSLARRAQLFDLSPCYINNFGSIQGSQTMELVVSYPIEPNLARYVQGRSHEMIDEFYLASINWSILEKSTQSNTSMSLEKQRLGVSLNYLRVPKVEFLGSSFSSMGEFKLKLLILDRASPLHLFDQMLESTFVADTIEERFLVSHIGECAHFCQLHNCRLFAYDESSLECKLSPISVEDQLEEDDEIVGGDQLVILRKATSIIYYAPSRQDKIDSQAPVEEASLAELYSYLEHSVGELDSNGISGDGGGQEDGDDGDQVTVVSRRAKRDAGGSPGNWPLLSFKYTDRSDPKLAYSPQKRKLLVPSEIKAIRVPLTFDFSQEFQKVKVASAFRAQESGKKYEMITTNTENPFHDDSALDDQTFVAGNDTSILYSLKRLHQLELETCALMCYNIDEWNSRIMGGQICQSFSYCRGEKQCILMVETDSKFTDIIAGQEGEQVLNISSTDQFLADGPDCVISRRNYLAGFEGPIRLPENSTKSSYGDVTDSSLKYEWLTAISLESSEIYDDSQDNCAKACEKRNRVGKMCIALDFCLNKFPPGSKKNHKTTWYQATCDLLLISGDDLDSSAGSRTMIVRKIRDKLLSQLPLGQNETDSTPSNRSNKEASGFESTCNRYLVSHLSEFNHIKLRQVSQKLANQLTTSRPTFDKVNLENCALECSMRRDECLAFEYCSKFDYTTTRSLQINCTLFGGRIIKGSKLEGHLDPSGGQDEPVTSIYSRDCHIYLRNEFESLDDLVNGALNTSHQMTSVFDRHQLLFYCTIFFIVLIIIAYLYFRSKNRYNAPRIC